jgi:hypothetical protein
MNSIKIVKSRNGFCLRINGHFISMSFVDCSRFKSINSTSSLIPYGSTEWVSVKAIRDMWNHHRESVCESTLNPFKSIWGNLEIVD